ncbi:MAG: pyruvate dehydrogenase (acetyl-transferring) E1 component subunit alpha [Deltaproteobacteria bacterium]|nr:pyruvate dehydrogenase (acetyl-transferring) E1 component subunit alpha [Deltaproteobacteria bacterium]
MPRKPIALPYQVEYLSILNEKGEVDKDLEPGIPGELLVKLFKAMMLGRKFDQRLLNLQRQGRIGTFAPITGQEASQLGAVTPLRSTDWTAPSFRETAADLWRGKSMETVILNLGGYNEVWPEEPLHNDLPVSIPVASQVLHAVGIAWGMKYREKDDVAMTFFGDGGTSEGDFHEGMNLAGVYQLPVIFVCQNNQWAISLPRSRQTRSKTLAQKALAYDIPGIQVDGNDILAVYAASSEAVDRARSGGGPTFIECVTYRMMMHTTADDPKRYRTDDEVEAWSVKDPVARFKKYLFQKGLLSEDMVTSMEKEIEESIQAAVDRAEEYMEKIGNPLDMFDHAYAELPSYLEEQREALARELGSVEKEESHG